MRVSDLRRQNRALWRDVFHDDEGFLDLYFRRVFTPACTWAVEQPAGRLAAALQALPYTLRLDGRRVEAIYLSGIATRPDCRRQGLASGLIRQAHAAAAARGVELAVLIPAGEALAAYYARHFGYVAASRVADVPVEALQAAAEGRQLRPIAVPARAYDVYARLVQARRRTVVQTAAQWAVACEAWRRGGGTVWGVWRGDEPRALAFCQRRAEGWRLADGFWATPADAWALVALLQAEAGGRSVVVKQQLAVDAGGQGALEPGGADSALGVSTPGAEADAFGATNSELGAPMAELLGTNSTFLTPAAPIDVASARTFAMVCPLRPGPWQEPGFWAEAPLGLSLMMDE